MLTGITYLWKNIGTFISRPVFDEEAKTRTSHLLSLLIAVLVVFMLLEVFFSVTVFAARRASLNMSVAFIILLLVSYILMRAGSIRIAGLLLVTGFWFFLTALIVFSGGMDSVNVLHYLTITIIAGLLFGPRSAAFVCISSSVAGYVLMLAASHNFLPNRIFPTPTIAAWVNMTLGLVLVTVLVSITLDNLNKALSLTRRKLEERMKIEETLRLNESRLQALLTFNEMHDAPLEDLIHHAMDEAVRLTGSTVGYIAFTDTEEKNLIMYAWSSEAMNECRIKDKPIVYPIETTGLWGEACRQRRAIVTNDYAADNPWKKGLPDGHVPIERHMNIPVFDGQRIVIVAGVGNKPADYDASDIRQLDLLMNGLWRLVEKRRAENQILLSLQEKEILLQEVHHRVKNNLQIINSLLNMQSGLNQSPETRAHLREAMNRITAMATIHDFLYQSENVGCIDVQSYSERLLMRILQSWGSQNVTYSLQFDQVDMSIDAAIPCGLILNELLTNSLKHGFRDNRPGHISIGLSVSGEEESYTLTVSDNGTGFPSTIMRDKKDSTLGMKIIDSLVSQLNGKLEMETRNGTTFRITFPRQQII